MENKEKKFYRISYRIQFLLMNLWFSLFKDKISFFIVAFVSHTSGIFHTLIVQPNLGSGIKSKVLRPTQFWGGRSEGRITHETIKADRPLSTVVNRESEIHVKFGLLTLSQFLLALIASFIIQPSDPLPVSVVLNVQTACWT